MIKEEPNKEKNNSLFLETGLFTINTIFRALMWILYVLICAGWGNFKTEFFK